MLLFFGQTSHPIDRSTWRWFSLFLVKSNEPRIWDFLLKSHIEPHVYMFTLCAGVQLQNRNNIVINIIFLFRPYFISISQNFELFQ
jgi:hypothetical protein